MFYDIHIYNYIYILITTIRFPIVQSATVSFAPGIPVEFCREKMLEAAIAAAKRILEAIFYTEGILMDWRISKNFYQLQTDY